MAHIDITADKIVTTNTGAASLVVGGATPTATTGTGGVNAGDVVATTLHGQLIAPAGIAIDGATPETHGIKFPNGGAVPSDTLHTFYSPDGATVWFNGVQLATGSAVSGTTGQLAKFTASSTLGDALTSESGTTQTLLGQYKVQSGVTPGLLLGADANARTLTNSTDKKAILALPHYTNAENPVGLIYGDAASGSNTISIGGGITGTHAATAVKVYTGATTTTDTGTQRVYVAAGVRIGSTATDPGAGNLYIEGTTTAIGTITGNLNGTATTATTATNVTITTDGTTNATMYPAWVSATTGDLPATTSSSLTFNPSSGTLGSTVGAFPTVNATNVNGVTVLGTSAVVTPEVQGNSSALLLVAADSGSNNASLTLSSGSALISNAAVNVTIATDSSSSTTGAIKTAGGLGVAKSAFIGATLGIKAATITGPATTAGTLTIGNCATVTAPPVVVSSTDNIIGVSATMSHASYTSAVFQGTTSRTSNAAFKMLSLTTGTGDVFVVDGRGAITTDLFLASTTASTSGTTGALKVAGGVGVAGGLCVTGGVDGCLAVGGTLYSHVLLSLGLNGNPLTNAHQVGGYSAITGNSNVTGVGGFVAGFETGIGVAAGSIVLPTINNYATGFITVGAGSSITRSWGLSVVDETAATHNAAIANYNAAFTGNWFIYYDGTRKSQIGTGDLIGAPDKYQATASSYTRLSGGDAPGSGATIAMFGQSHASAANKMTLSASAGITVTGDVIGPTERYQALATTYTRIAGGDAAGAGATILMFGQSHATNANKMALSASGGINLSGLGSFAAGDKYVIIDASGNLHVSALGPAS